jgi:glycogen operon protein
VRGDKGLLSELATRICGSSDMYEYQGRLPISSVNFVTCHDGFTLHDLFSYNEKHNEANGEDSRDGCSNNISYNCGIEGDTDNAGILELRRKQAKNVFAILLLSQGVPMLLAGDEVLHSQRGNNNCYCQDNELSWIDWGLTRQNADNLRFVQLMIALRKRHPSIMRRRFLTGKDIEGKNRKDISWHGVALNQPLWFDPEARLLVFTLAGIEDNEADLHIVMNMSDEIATLELPVIDGKKWCLALDTALPSPQDIIPLPDQKPFGERFYAVNGKAIAVFENTEF